MASPLEQLLNNVQNGLTQDDYENLEYIKNNEGFIKRAKLDDTNKKTYVVGYGIDSSNPSFWNRLPEAVRSGKEDIDPKLAEKLLLEYYPVAKRDAMAYTTPEVFNSLNKEQQRALIDMSYNLGLSKLSGFEKMRRGIFENNPEKMKMELLDSNYARQVKGRANRNAELLSGIKNGVVSETKATSDSSQPSSFGQAFKKARAEGLKVFTYNGKKYTTEVK
jgi:lysozyme